ncbi:MAG: bifunctional ADP-dependent NAD(P)H-hydrate dehydratase/NAD(P)H-hydrate epimerase [Proteobacteria bacterium]|nr:MAG: bifunctional ADP-dependent NAD(P)H-hydrate dehydratase/NAD(P)H-hydrate epimerase [Pseudomonadota bacterium]
MKALTAAEMREVDRITTERYGIPSLKLMDAAGKHVADAVLRRFPPEKGPRVVVLCGKGNNGGDGFAASHYLRKSGVTPAVHLFGEPRELQGDARTNFDRYVHADGKVSVVSDEASWRDTWASIAAADVIVDGLLGTGLRGPAKGFMARTIEAINQFSRNAQTARPALILAIDTPSGLPSDGQPAEGPVLRAHETVTFTAPKVGQLVSVDAPSVGQLTVRNIGSPRALVEESGRSPIRWVEAEEFAEWPLIRQPDSNKGLFGHALVIAGSVGKSGAAVMAGLAALRTGAGLVTVATPQPVLPIVGTGYPEYMTEPLAATKEGTVASCNLESGRFAEASTGKTVFAVGPGLGLHPETQAFIGAVVRDSELPIVLDADGLNAFAGRADQLRDRKGAFLAITPHPGEMARLMQSTTRAVQQDRVKTATETAKRWNAHVVLKGFHTIIAAPEGPVFVSTAGNPGLAKGGSGDVLTGVLAAITAQFGTSDWARVLALGVELHGRAADLAIEGTDPSGILADEIAAAVPMARRAIVEELRAHA